jgi:hypothetical protein
MSVAFSEPTTPGDPGLPAPAPLPKLRFGDEVVGLSPGEDFQATAQLWTRKVRNRRRWSGQPDLRRQQEQDSAALLAGLGLDAEAVARLGQAAEVEVEIPFVEERAGWELRIFPWEYVITAGVRFRRPAPNSTPLVIRRLACEDEGGAGVSFGGKTLIVRSAPGQVHDLYSFDSEVKLVKSSLGAEQAVDETDPSRSSLAARVKGPGGPFAVIHLAGIDAHEAVARGILPDAPVWDGYVVRGEGERLTYLNSRQLAEALTADGRRPPFLVSCNFFNSASRLAPMLVASGAASAVAFQDELDDLLAEQFYSTFYLALKLSGGNLLAAFRYAYDRLRGEATELTGSGIVLWSRRSLLASDAAAERQAITMVHPGLGGADPAPTDAAMDMGVSSTAAPHRRRAARGRAGGLAVAGEAGDVETPGGKAGASAMGVDAGSVDTSGGKPGAAVLEAAAESFIQQAQATPLEPDKLEIEIRPLKEINYALLHNRRPLFERFYLKLSEVGRIDVKVTVELEVGSAQAARYEARVPIKQWRDLRPEVCIPLTYVLRGALREGVNTTLRVTIANAADDSEIRSETHRVTLLPFDEWKDDDSNRIWLPSFVLPRDPAIRRVIDAAQRYLMALCDDSDAGFDGYQSEGDDDGGVDLQVQAIWYALLYDCELHYINPPPSYGDRSQRLRTPGDLLSGKRGTCIDLALLLAACLEYVEIYPVIFLLHGHAFPGYWRSDRDHQDFLLERGEPKDAASCDGRTGLVGATGDRKPAWYIEDYDVVLPLVREGKIRPLETVWLTRRGSFGDALEEGMKNLRSKNDFEALIDVHRARQEVTPIPIPDER